MDSTSASSQGSSLTIAVTQAAIGASLAFVAWHSGEYVALVLLPPLRAYASAFGGWAPWWLVRVLMASLGGAAGGAVFALAVRDVLRPSSSGFALHRPVIVWAAALGWGRFQVEVFFRILVLSPLAGAVERFFGLSLDVFLFEAHFVVATGLIGAILSILMVAMFTTPEATLASSMSLLPVATLAAAGFALAEVAGRLVSFTIGATYLFDLRSVETATALIAIAAACSPVAGLALAWPTMHRLGRRTSA